MAEPKKKDTIQADKRVVERFDRLKDKAQKKLGSRPRIYRQDFLIQLMDEHEGKA